MDEQQENDMDDHQTIRKIINIPKKRTCGEPPSNIGDLVLIGKQGDAAFYDCPGIDLFQHEYTPTCPIIYCQDNGNYSTPVFEPDVSLCGTPDVDIQVIESPSGEITSANYPSNYNPMSTASVIAWNILVQGKNLKFKVEDLDIDQDTEILLVCGLGEITWTDDNEAALIGFEFTCKKPCAQIILFQSPGPGGRGFKISFTS
ncbi:hypothetical protein CHS0354_027521 [Potamilus streckersoni]|uniref:CUB domain-containing protein n=1 Tax=Potamilus streckersoni TaxID=2493646 RepID=A0AAE0VQF7_9BIVA|nr:hypothetical protein CHS0354_027521 [Potamilus streckersoni]